MRRGQMWTMDFAVSLFFFFSTMLIAYTLILNTVEDRGFDDVQRQATGAADLLASEGYPEHWLNENVIRGGLLANGKLSLRKVREMAKLDDSELHKALRIMDNINIQIENESGDVQSLFYSCTLGNYQVGGAPEGNASLKAIAIVQNPTLAPLLENITIYEDDDAAYSVIDEQDVILLEGDFTRDSQLTRTQIARMLADAAKNGITIFMVGDVNMSLLGIDKNNVETLNITFTTEIQEDVVFDPGERLALDPPNLVNITTVTASADPALNNFNILGTADDGSTAYATWLYNDAKVFFVSAVEGSRENGNDLLDQWVNITQGRLTVPRPECVQFSVPVNAEQVAHQERVVGFHDSLFTIRTVVWRNP